MLLDLNVTKSFLRVDFDDDDLLITMLIEAAENYIYEATGKTFDSSNKLAQLAALKIITLNYSERSGIIDKKSLIIPRFIDSDLFKLKYSKGVSTDGQEN